MFSNLFGKILGNGQQGDSSPSRSIKSRVTDIGDQLKLYREQNLLFTVVLKADGNHHGKLAKMSTGIMDVDVKGKRFATDPLLPKETNRLLTTGAVVLLSFTHQGIRHQFECLWLGSEGKDDQLRHWFDFPKGIEQIQLRDAFRVKFSQAHPIKVALTHAEKPPITGTLADLSATGMRMRTQGLLNPEPERGEVYNSCHFVLSDGQAITCAASLMHWQHDTELGVTFMGIRFEQLDGGTQRALNRYLNELQRKQRL